ncbi:MAG TPA: prepilin-type N-terminal cleavage/methylation domain-containing protein [Desulfobacterales bacterium]|nr:prepilin-type N-terminal cleavage/methylation domain-containing protein [Desulfobacterales bacterium]
MFRLSNKKGFTLIEVMIVVAIVGILAAIAIPAYSDFVTKCRLSEVWAALDRVAQAACEYHALNEHSVFPSDLSELGGGWSRKYGQIEVIQVNAREGVYGIRHLTNLPASVVNHYLYLQIIFSPNSGYSKQWITDLPQKFRPRQ